jgi:CrcB protein
MGPLTTSLVVGLGSALGGIGRHWLSLLVDRSLTHPGGVPWGTLAVNLLGSLGLGLVLFGVQDHHHWRLFLATGLMGGFTTYSTFSAQTWILLQQGSYGGAAWNVGLTLVLCLAGSAIGWWLGSWYTAAGG